MRHRRLAYMDFVALTAVFLVAVTASYVLCRARRKVYVLVRSEPSSATVFVAGRAVGISPVTLSLDEGERLALRLVRKGYLDTFHVVDARRLVPSTLVARLRWLFRDKTFEVAVRMKPVASAALVLTTEPEGAEVFLDGRRLGLTPLTARGLTPGQHTLHVTHPECFALTEQVDLSPQGETRLHMRLRDKVTALYRGLIAKEPGALTHYTELAHYYVLRARFAEAAEVLREGLEALRLKEARDQSRYFQELWRIYIRQFEYPPETGESAIRPVCRRLMQEALEKRLWNRKAIQNYIRQMDRYDRRKERRRRR